MTATTRHRPAHQEHARRARRRIPRLPDPHRRPVAQLEGAAYVARGSVHNAGAVARTKRMFKRAFETQLDGRGLLVRRGAHDVPDRLVHPDRRGARLPARRRWARSTSWASSRSTGHKTTEELHEENVRKAARGRVRRSHAAGSTTRWTGRLRRPRRRRSGRSSGRGSTSTSTPELLAAADRCSGATAGSPELAALRAWNRELADARYAAIAWPEEYGGRGATVIEQLVFTEEMHRSGAPGTVNVIGLSNIAPAIMQHGTADQKRTFLPRMLRGDDIWCQGFSEPDAGSDLASADDLGGARRRPLRRQRPEDVEHARPPRELVRAARAHRPATRRSTRASRACSSTCRCPASRSGR